MGAAVGNNIHQRVALMKNRMVAIVLLCYLPLGCAFVSEKAKMEQYGRILDSYETAMRMSDFNALCQFVDPHENVVAVI